MASAKDIARNMVSVISDEKGSNGWLTGLVEGLIDLPVDLFYLGYDFTDTEHRSANDNDKYRFAALVKSGLANRESIQKVLEIVISEYFSKLNNEQKEKLLETKVARFLAGIVSKNMILGDIGVVFANRLAMKILGGFVITSTLGLGAMVSRAVYTSRALMEEFPEIYWKLRGAGNLDLLYFLVENHAKPFQRALNTYKDDKVMFDSIFSEFLQMLE